MNNHIKLAMLLGLFVAPPVAAAKSDCPPREPGTYPWITNGTVKGDLWAWVYLELDKTGRPKRCLMGNNNIRDSELRFFACRAMQEDWRPATEEEARAVASTTVRRFFVIHGPEHEKRIREARKRFFAKNPDERPECYPEG